MPVYALSMLLVTALVLLTKLLSVNAVFSTAAAKQAWRFVEVRPGAHLFYWLYYTSANVGHYTERPLVIWLHGGPGDSSTGSANFEYFGPIDLTGNKRKNSWVEHVNILFIDSPVGAGFSYVEVEDLYTTSTSQIVGDLVNCMKDFYAQHREFEAVPLHIFSESYGGKMAPEFALELHEAVKRGEVNANVKSVTVGNPFISLVEATLSRAPFLLQTGIIDLDGQAILTKFAFQLIEHVDVGKPMTTFYETYDVPYIILNQTAGIDLYNINQMHNASEEYGFNPKLTQLMRGPVTSALNITTGIEWAAKRDVAFDYLTDDMSNSSAAVVQQLLNSTPIKLAFYSGQLDSMCSTLGTVTIIDQMEWRDKPAYLAADRKPIIIDSMLEGYEKSNGKFSMFWVNRAGHLVPLDQPKVMHYILKKVTNYS